MSNKKFWSTVKPFLFNKDFISVEKDGDVISNEKEIVELFNLHKHSGKLLREETFITWRLLKRFSR